MKLTPLDIKKQEFRKVMRGYDPIEVETFLEMVSDEFESLIKEKNHLSDEVLKLKTQLKDYQEVEKTFKESLMSAQETINQSRDNSKREANLIIKEAELKAEKLLEDTKIRLIEMKNELMLIKSQKDSFARRLRHLLESQLELIGVLELDDLGLGKMEKLNRIPDISRSLQTRPPVVEKNGNPTISRGSDHMSATGNRESDRNPGDDMADEKKNHNSVRNDVNNMNDNQTTKKHDEFIR
ncbi:DivIVA domain-containing protein [candidate division KSB1 bacterium]|nr:DivIVA domain-containing protein [candidate division KSB1 bacterium]